MEKFDFKLKETDYTRLYSEQTDCKRHVVGAYANLALHNMTTVVNSIRQAVGLDTITDDTIKDAFSGDSFKGLDAGNQLKLQNKLFRHFPFLRRMKLEQHGTLHYSKVINVMKDFIKLMSIIRDDFSHYCPYSNKSQQTENSSIKKNASKKLDEIFTNSVSQNLHTAEENEVRCSVQNSKTQQDKKASTPPVSIPMSDNAGLTDAGIVFFLCCFLEKHSAFEFLEEIKFTEGLNPANALYVKEILCMNRIRMTRSQIDSQMSDTALALDMMNELRKCPKPLYDVLDPSSRNYFKDDANLQWEEDNPTQTDSQSPDSHNITDLRAKSVPRSTFVRWQNRFPEMALCFIDLKRLFPTIRFQLRLGNYRYRFYTHTAQQSLDGRERLRILQKELHGFGRIDEIEQTIKKEWGQYIEKNTTDPKPKDQPDRTPYITHQRPQYNIDPVSHSIGLCWDFPDEKTYYIPEFPPKKQDDHTQQQKCSSENLAPQCYLNTDELPALLFYQYIKEKYRPDKGSSAEDIIQKCYINLHTLFSQLADNKAISINELDKWELRPSDIPAKIRKLMEGHERSEQEIRDSLRRSIEHQLTLIKKTTKKRIAKYKAATDKKEQTDQKNTRFRPPILTGRLAQQLIDDIVWWLPTDSPCRSRLTSEKYNILQASIALLGQRTDPSQQTVTIDDLRQMMERIGLLGPDGHPFLSQVFKQPNQSAGIFYHNYLSAEQDHIETLWQDFDLNLDQLISQAHAKLPFVHIDRPKWNVDKSNNLSQLAQKYLTHPLQLPLGLFAQPIAQLLRDIAEGEATETWKQLTAEIDRLTQKGQPSTLKLIELYHKNIEEDDFQNFYNSSPNAGFQHHYELFKKLYNEKGLSVEEVFNLLRRKSDSPQSKSQLDCDIHKYVKRHCKDKSEEWAEDPTALMRKQAKQVEQTEHAIRRCQIEDIVMLYAARDILSAKNNRTPNGTDTSQPQKFKLKHVQKDDELLERTIDFDWVVDIEGKQKTIRQQNMKMKDYGKFYKFASDGERLKSLLAHLGGNEFQRADIEAEYAQYDDCRSQVFRYVYMLENKAYQLLAKRKDNPIDLLDDKNSTRDVFWFVSKEGIRNEFRGFKENLFNEYKANDPDAKALVNAICNFTGTSIEEWDANQDTLMKQVKSLLTNEKPNEKGDELILQVKDYCMKKKIARKAIRNNFGELIEILLRGDEPIFTNDEKYIIQHIRNAFGHNHYLKKEDEYNTVFSGKEAKRKLPEVAKTIKDWMGEKTTKAISLTPDTQRALPPKSQAAE